MEEKEEPPINKVILLGVIELSSQDENMKTLVDMAKGIFKDKDIKNFLIQEKKKMENMGYTG